jgi:nitroreductase
MAPIEAARIGSRTGRRRRLSAVAGIAIVIIAFGPPFVGAEALKPVQLPPPQTDGGKPLMQALKLRSTSRAFATDPLPLQTLSNLLWAAWGINRPGEGKRTAPSARNWQEIDLLIVDTKGAWRYDAAANTLEPLAAGDLRPLAGMQEFVKDAPVTLLFVADTARMKGSEAATREAYAWADAAFISQNVYLYCASEGLATGVRAMVDRPALAKALGLGADKIIAFAQSVGFPRR